MNPREAYLLSPYKPPTTYPVSLNPDEAESWLQGYFALWHPAALHRRTRPPQSASPYDHEVPAEGFLYAVPTGPTLYLPDDWSERVRLQGAASFMAHTRREPTRANLREALAATDVPRELLAAPVEVIALFAALGYGYLLVESLFDAMEHDHLLDAEEFWAGVQEAVTQVAAQAPLGEIRARLKAAGEKLATARQTLNSNPIRLFDFAMLHEARLGAGWPESLHCGLPLNVIASVEQLEQLAAKHPERFAELRSHVSPDLPSRVELCIGAHRERDDALLLAESQLWNLRAAQAGTHRLFGVYPRLYARQRTALHPQLPSWLAHSGFQNAVAIPLDGALAPTRNAAVVNWQAPDGKTMDAFGREPHNAADPATFFNLVYHLHQALTQDSTPAVAFKHLGEDAAVGYQELLGTAELGDIIGEWVGLSRFFSEHHYGDYLGYATADDYFSDYLDDRVTQRHSPVPVSGFARLARCRRKLDGTFTLAALHRSLTAPAPGDDEFVAELEQVEHELELQGADLPPQPGPWYSRLEEHESRWARRLAERIQVRSPEGPPGYLVFNPCNFTRRVALEIADFGGPITIADPVKAAEFLGSTARLVVEVPSLGFAWFPRGTPGGAPLRSRLKTAEGAIVRNEYIEAEFDPVTGFLRAFRDLRTRVNRLGMQMVFNPGCKTRARSVRVTQAGTALGEVVCDGEILDEHDAVLATFRNRLRAWVGRPALELRIEIEPNHLPSGYPWHAYYGARFVWRDERATLFRGVNGANTQTTYTRPVSPDYLEVRLGSERTFLFTGGLPFLQKQGGRSADVILIPEGEQARSFDLLLACDRDYPMQTAVGWIAPAPLVATTKGPPPTGPSGWLAHVDLPSLILTDLRPVQPSAGMSRAVAARGLETAGFGGSAEIRFARDPARAMAIDGLARTLQELALAHGGVPIDFSAGELFRIQAEWAE